MTIADFASQNLLLVNDQWRFSLMRLGPGVKLPAC
jgi:hypothetical protein